MINEVRLVSYNWKWIDYKVISDSERPLDITDLLGMILLKGLQNGGPLSSVQEQLQFLKLSYKHLSLSSDVSSDFTSIPVSAAFFSCYIQLVR